MMSSWDHVVASPTRETMGRQTIVAIDRGVVRNQLAERGPGGRSFEREVDFRVEDLTRAPAASGSTAASKHRSRHCSIRPSTRRCATGSGPCTVRIWPASSATSRRAR